MYVSAIGMNNFNFKGRSGVQNSPAQIGMKQSLNADTVSFGSTKTEAMKNCINMSKEIFTELNSLDRVPVEKQAESFLEAAKAALAKIKQNLTSMKDADLPTKGDKFAVFGNTEVHSYKLPMMDGYIFEQYTKPVGGKLHGNLLNSIEVAPELDYVKILHRHTGEREFTREAKGALSEGADSVRSL